MRYFLHFFYALCFVLFLSSNNKVIAQTYNFEVFSVDKGLSQSEVTSIKEDSRGYMWVGTAGGGVCMFDGLKFTCFEEKDGLSSKLVSCIEEDPNGNIFIGTLLGGISVYSGNKFKVYTKENGLLSDKINSIVSSKDGKMYIAHDNGISIMDNSGSVSIFKDVKLAGKNCQRLYKDDLGNIWMITDMSLYLYDGHTVIDINQKTSDSIFSISCIKQDGEKYWIGTKGRGLYSIVKSGYKYIVTPFEKNSELQNALITDLIIDNTKNLWIGMNGYDVIKWNGNQIKVFNRENGLSSSNIATFFKDEMGNLWLGTIGGGLIKYNSELFTYYDNVEGLKNNNVYAVLSLNNGTIWASVPGRGIFCYDGVKTTNYTIEDGLLSNYVKSLYQDKEGVVWIGCNNGLCNFKNNKIEAVNSSLIKGTVKAILKDSKGFVWVGTFGGGLIKFKDNTVEYFTNKNGLIHNYVHSLLEDKKGNIWIGTGAGVQKYSNGKFTEFPSSTAFCNTYIGSIVEDKMGRIWFGTDKCIVKFDETDFKSYDQNDGLASNTVYLMVVDKENNLWVGGNKGVDKISFDEKGNIGLVKNYSSAEGFKGIECNAKAVSMDTVGNIFFGTLAGVIKYSPKEENPLKDNIHLAITEIKLFFKDTDWSQYSSKETLWFGLPENLSLPYNQNYLSFNYIGICHTVPQKVRYLCKLEGFDSEWIDNSNETSITYTNLASGDYTFKVKAYILASSDYSTVEYKFTIQTPFWKTWWFYGIVILLVLLLIYYMYNYYTHRMKSDFERLESQVLLRTNEILKQKREIEILLQEIHHRVKNNLQIVNSLISLQSSYISDPKILEIFNECKNRIITMSLIHEKLYESKDFTKLDLKDYLTRLTNFLKSSYTINNTIRFEIKTNVQSFGIDSIIPIGLIVTEIVSNSLKYAFIENSIGIIKVHINKVNDTQFELIVSDNGVGYIPSKNHESATFGLELIKILSDQLNGKIERLNEKGVGYRLLFEKIVKSAVKHP